MEGTPRLMAELMFGSGVRLTELLRLRIKDVDLERGQLIVRAGKQPGPLVIEATREGDGSKLASARLVIEAKPTRRRPAVA